MERLDPVLEFLGLSPGCSPDGNFPCPLEGICDLVIPVRDPDGLASSLLQHSPGQVGMHGHGGGKPVNGSSLLFKINT